MSVHISKYVIREYSYSDLYFKILLILLKISPDERLREILFPAGIINISFPSYLVFALTDGILIRAVVSRLNCSALLAGTERIGNRAAVSCEKDRISPVSLSPCRSRRCRPVHPASCTRPRLV